MHSKRVYACYAGSPLSCRLFCCIHARNVLYSAYPHEDAKRIVSRIARAAGRLQAIDQMAEEALDRFAEAMNIYLK